MQNLKLNSKWVTKKSESRLYNIPVPIIGLTGGIATGKSTVAEHFRRENIPVIDADSLVKKVYQKKEIKNFIENNFSDAITKDIIDFKKLRQIAFNSPENIKKIESEIYKYLPSEFLNEFKKFPLPNFVVYDVPLLFEKGLDIFVDLKVCVYCPKSLQAERLMKRDNIDAISAEKILNHQLDINEKKMRSDLVIENIGDIESLNQNFKKFFEQLF